jgi:murein L,D-transpeptidase YafK
MRVVRRLVVGAVVVGGLAAWLLRPPARTPVVGCSEAEVQVSKTEGTLSLLCDGLRVRRFPATFGASPHGPKTAQGDEHTPEGRYVIVDKSASARFDRFLLLSYPNEDDRRRAARAHAPDPGNGIGIHGVSHSLRLAGRAWIRFASVTRLAAFWGPTDGCVGLMNEDVEVLFDAVKVGTPVRIDP